MDSLVGAFVEMPLFAASSAVAGGGAYGKVVTDLGSGRIVARPLVGWDRHTLLASAYAILAPEDGAELVEYLEREETPEDERPYIYTDCAELIELLERIDEQVTAAPVSLAP